MHVFAFESQVLYPLALATTSFDLPFSLQHPLYPLKLLPSDCSPHSLLHHLPPTPGRPGSNRDLSALSSPFIRLHSAPVHSHTHTPQVLIPFVLFIQLGSLLPLLCLQGNTIESEHLSELTEEEYEAHIYQRQDLKGFMWLDAKYLNPFFTRRLTQEVSGEKVSWAAASLAGPVCYLFLCEK